MEIQLADHLGMCFGVRDAIALAQQQSSKKPLTILGDLVHNPGVLHDLKKRGVESTRDIKQVATSSVMITAHGSSDRIRQTLAQHKFAVHDATCPLVRHAHQQLANLVAQGCFPIIIGKAGHVEVQGLIGDLAEYQIISAEADIQKIPARPRYGIVAQTTQPIERVRQWAQKIQEQFPRARVEFRDTVCQPTKNRQWAARRLASLCDIALVIGGANSNNTRELFALCSSLCRRVHHLQSAADLQPEWFRETDRVGITAGTSTPQDQIQSIVATLQRWNSRPPAVPAKTL